MREQSQIASLVECACCAGLRPTARGAGLSRRRLLAAGTAAFAATAVAASTALRCTKADAQAPAAPSAAAKPHRIDVHHHIAPPAYVAETRALQLPPTLNWTVEKSLEDMDKAGVATAITSITTPGVWIGDDAQGRHLARVCNEYAASLVADHPGRFGMFAALPLPDTEGSLREIEYGLDVLKADGIGLFTSYRDKWLGDSAFDPVMAELNRRQAVVYTHPEAALCCRGLIPGIHESMIEYGTDTTRAITRLLFSGAAARYPDIKWIFSHGGGTMPFLVERLIRAPIVYKHLAPAVPNGVLSELKRFYYDTAQAAYPSALAALTRLIPVSQVLWGTDFPYRRGEEYVRLLADFGFSADDLRRIDRDNALALMPRLKA
jgi:predicted TIM-barrel fold metal-dependent hydrolase